MATATTSTSTRATTGAASDAEPFAGFSRAAIDFLAELAANNERTWFQPRKADYERLLKRPMEALCLALGERFAARGIPLVSDPARSPHRIYRDTRFASDKSPYKTHASARFPWAGDNVDRGAGSDATSAAHDMGGPSGYFHLQPGEVYIGGGLWRPGPELARSLACAGRGRSGRRPRGHRHPAFVRTFGDIHGDSLKRMPTGYPPDHPEALLLKLKDVTFGRRLSDAEALSPSCPTCWPRHSPTPSRSSA